MPCKRVSPPFRLIVIRKDDKQLSLPGMMPLIGAFVTDLDGELAELSAFYRQRGDHCENRIKELKRDLAAGCPPCSDLATDAAWFKLNGFAYNLHVAIRTTLYPFKRHTLSTIRWHCYQIVGVIIYHGHRWVLKISDYFYGQLSVQRPMLWRDLAPPPSPPSLFSFLSSFIALIGRLAGVGLSTT